MAAAISIVSPDAASELACPIVAQAEALVAQLLRLAPLTPLTYQVLASAGEDRMIRTPRTGILVQFQQGEISSGKFHNPGFPRSPSIGPLAPDRSPLLNLSATIFSATAVDPSVAVQRSPEIAGSAIHNQCLGARLPANSAQPITGADLQHRIGGDGRYAAMALRISTISPSTTFPTAMRPISWNLTNTSGGSAYFWRCFSLTRDLAYNAVGLSRLAWANETGCAVEQCPRRGGQRRRRPDRCPKAAVMPQRRRCSSPTTLPCI